MRALLIAEKPSLRRTIETVYKKYQKEIPYDAVFMEQRGHLLTLLLPDELDPKLKRWEWQTLPIEPESLGGWHYKLIQEKKTGNFLTASERYAAIRKKLTEEHFDFIINAGDPDQEGELLIRIVLAELDTGLPVKRFWSNDTTEPKVLEALKNLKDDDADPMLVNLLKAAYARQHSDYRVGMNISRAASLKMNSRVACGRVKTPIMSIVCRREIEIRDFVPQTVYGVKVKYAEDFDGQLLEQGSLTQSKSKNVADGSEEGSDSSSDAAERDENAGLRWFDKKEDAEALIKELHGNAEVIRYESKKQTIQPPKLYKLATLQIAAGKLGYNSSKTLEIVQSLYEKGYVSYPRTDCEFISSNEKLYDLLKSCMSVPELAEHIKTITNGAIRKVSSSKRWVNDKKLAEAGHSALIPTSYKPDFARLSREQQDIYRLICRQFTAIFLPPMVQKKVELVTNICGEFFRSTGRTLVDEGYTVLFNTKSTDALIPKHRAGDILETNGFELCEKTSSCPKRFTDADLIAVCESPIRFLTDSSHKALGRALKIGTSATRASIIEELINRDKYLCRVKEKKNTYIVPTDEGMRIYERLKDRKICQVDMTAEWEEQLEDIRSGRLELAAFESSMRDGVRAMVEDIRSLGITSGQQTAGAVSTARQQHGVRQAAAGSGRQQQGAVTAGASGQQQQQGAGSAAAGQRNTVRSSGAASGRDKNSSQSYGSGQAAGSTAYRIVGKCPECGGHILSGKKGYFCSNFKKGCGAGCYKEFTTPDGNTETITDEEFARLLKGEAAVNKAHGQGHQMLLRYDLPGRRIIAESSRVQ